MKGEGVAEGRQRRPAAKAVRGGDQRQPGVTVQWRHQYQACEEREGMKYSGILISSIHTAQLKLCGENICDFLPFDSLKCWRALKSPCRRRKLSEKREKKKKNITCNMLPCTALCVPQLTAAKSGLSTSAF
jgi:hypothetical protein